MPVWPGPACRGPRPLYCTLRQPHGGVCSPSFPAPSRPSHCQAAAAWAALPARLPYLRLCRPCGRSFGTQSRTMAAIEVSGALDASAAHQERQLALGLHRTQGVSGAAVGPATPATAPPIIALDRPPLWLTPCYSDLGCAAGSVRSGHCHRPHHHRQRWHHCVGRRHEHLLRRAGYVAHTCAHRSACLCAACRCRQLSALPAGAAPCWAKRTTTKGASCLWAWCRAQVRAAAVRPE